MRGALPDGFSFGVLGALAWDASSCGICQSSSILLDFDHAFDVSSAPARSPLVLGRAASRGGAVANDVLDTHPAQNLLDARCCNHGREPVSTSACCVPGHSPSGFFRSRRSARAIGRPGQGCCHTRCHFESPSVVARRGACRSRPSSIPIPDRRFVLGGQHRSVEQAHESPRESCWENDSACDGGVHCRLLQDDGTENPAFAAEMSKSLREWRDR